MVLAIIRRDIQLNGAILQLGLKKNMHTYSDPSLNLPLLYIAKYGGTTRLVIKCRLVHTGSLGIENVK